MDETYFAWCTNSGEINAHASAGGMVGFCNGVSSYTDCANLAEIHLKLVGEPDLTQRYDTCVGGIAGQLGNADLVPCEFINCINYANLTVCGNNNMVGGIAGRGDVVFYAENCVNFGDLLSSYKYNHPEAPYLKGLQGGRMAGIVPSCVTFQGYNCVNFGDLIWGDNIINWNMTSGIVGLCGNNDPDYPLTLENCMNYGTIDSRAKVTPDAEIIGNKYGTHPTGLAGNHIQGQNPVIFKNCISGGKIYTESWNCVSDIILFQNTGHAQIEGNVFENVYYYEDAVEEGTIRFQVGENYASTPDGVIRLEVFEALIHSYTDADIKDTTTAGLAGKMNAAAGANVVACVKVQLDTAEQKVVVVPTAILDLIAEYIVK
jgi:hypothetical protein